MKTFIKYAIKALKWFVGLIMKGCQKLFGWMSNGLAIIFLLAAQFALVAGVLKILPDNATAIAVAAWGITFVSTMTIGMKPITYFMTRYNRSEIEKEFQDRIEVAETIKQLVEEKNDKDKEIQELKGEVAMKDSELNTLRQTQYLVTNYKSSRELQILTVSKSGHIVKEEALYPLKHVKNKRGDEIFSDNFPKAPGRGFCFWNGNDLDENCKWRVFYSDNTLYKYGVGIKLDDVRYAIDSGVIYFKNVNLIRLSRHIENTGDYDPKADLTNHVWIVERDENEDYTIKNHRQHFTFKKRYKGLQQQMASDSIESAIDELCKQFTDGLHKMLVARYGDNIHFVKKDDEDFRHLNWKTLSEGMQTSKDVRAFMNDLYLAFDAMELCANNNPQLDKSLLTEQLSA
ncbi:MAG: hypothetical protein IKM69_00420 [Alistipes sp.]|nr:hypothetical protein [Alistipes sp.]